MNIQQLRSFCEVVRQGLSISAAANVLHASQPGISRQLKELEGELGVQLLVRKRNRIIALTEPGKLLIEVARNIVSDADRMRQIGQDFADSETGSLIISTTHAHARYTLPHVVKAYGGRYPGIQLNLVQGNPKKCGELVMENAADLGIAADMDEVPPGLIVLPAFQLRRSVIAPKGHPILRARTLSLEEIAKYPLVTYDKSFGVQAMLHDAFAHHRIRPNIVLRAIDADVIKTYVELGLGIAVVSTLVFDPSRDKEIRARDVTSLFRPGYVNVYMRRGGYLRDCALEFVCCYAPHLKRDLISKIVESGLPAAAIENLPLL